MLHSITKTLPGIKYTSCSNMALYKSISLHAQQHSGSIAWTGKGRCHTCICVWLINSFKRLCKSIVIRSSWSYTQQSDDISIEVGRKWGLCHTRLPPSALIWSSHQGQPHAVANNLYAKPDQSKIWRYNCGKLRSPLMRVLEATWPGPMKLPPMKRAKLNYAPARVVI